MIAGAWWLTPYMAEPIKALGWSVVAAGILQLAIQILSYGVKLTDPTKS